MVAAHKKGPMDNQLAIRDIPATILETSSDRVGSMVTKRLDSSVFERNVLVLHEPINVSIAHRKRLCIHAQTVCRLKLLLFFISFIQSLQSILDDVSVPFVYRNV